MKHVFRLLTLFLAFCLTASFAACSFGTSGNPSSKDTGEKETAPAVKGTVTAVGNFKVRVPDGWTSQVGSLIDKEDPNAFALFSSADSMQQIRFSVNDEDMAAAGVETTRGFNEESRPHDVTLEAGDRTYRGISYSYSSEDDCFQIYALFAEKAVVVQGSYCRFDSDLVRGILDSLEYNG